jgi:hypothetical protein
VVGRLSINARQSPVFIFLIRRKQLQKGLQITPFSLAAAKRYPAGSLPGRMLL